MSKALCVACRHEIDDAARVCPYCGSDPRSGEKIIDAQAMINQVFHPAERVSTTEGVLQFARQRQGVVIALGIVVLVLLLALFHQFVMSRNATAVSGAPAVPLTDIADLNDQSQEGQTLPMPDLQFQYDGNPKTMRAYVVEPGAVPPPQQNGPPASAGTPQAASPPAKAGAPSPKTGTPAQQ